MTLAAPQRVWPFLLTLLAVGMIASTMPTIVRRFGPARRRIEVVPRRDNASPSSEIVITAGTRMRSFDEAIVVRATKRDDALDLVRMDDDGCWHVVPHSVRADESIRM